MTATVLLLLAPLAAAPPAEPAPATAVTEAQIATWIAELRAEDRDKQQAAYNALLTAKPKSAVSALTKLLADKTAPGYYAVSILGAIGPDAKEALPALLALLPKEGGYGNVESVALALAKIDGPKPEATRSLLLGMRRCTPNLLVGSQVLLEYPAQVVQHLVALCGDKEPHVRVKAAAFLGTLKTNEVAKVPTRSLFELAGDSAKAVGPALEKLLADEKIEVRLAAARAISHVAPELTDTSLPVVVALGVQSTMMKKAPLSASDIFYPVPQQALKVLLPLFDDPNDGARGWAIAHVAQLPVREPIEDALLNGKTARVRQAAVLALGSRYSGATESVPALKTALGDTEFAVRFAAAVGLVQVGPRSSAAHTAALPVLVEGLQQKDEGTRIRASQNLLLTGPVAKDAIPALATLLDDPGSEVRFEAAIALVGIDPSKAAGGVPALIEGVKSSNDFRATRAAQALGTLGPVAKDAIPELVKRFDVKHAHSRLYAAEAVGRIDPAQAPKAVEVLVALLKEEKYKSNMIRPQSLLALRRIGTNAKPALPTLTELLKDTGDFHADVAVTMLVIDADGAKPALEWVRKVLTDKDNDDLYELTEVLPNLGAAAKPLIPELLALLQSKAMFQRERVIETLGAIGPDAKDALPELKKIAESDTRPRIRTAVADAVKKIEAK